jgi:glycosyltransferase involved in cell wall biosynthesis
VAVDSWALNPFLSFVIPAYNEEFELGGTLAAIRAASAAFDHEIVVVDDGSTDRTAEIAREGEARVVTINRRQISAARNAGARVARGEILFFVDADTRISAAHVNGALDALGAGCSGGGARVIMEGPVPRWAEFFLKVFSFFYFGSALAAGAFLFTTRANYEAVGGFDETYFAGEEVWFSMALKKLGRFKILREPVKTSGRKLRMHRSSQIWWQFMRLMIGGLWLSRRREGLDLWYDGKREGDVR